jgi:hypothetical protein
MGISGIQSQIALALIQGTQGAGGGQPAQPVAAPSALPGAQELAEVRVALEAQALTEGSVGQLVNALA